MGLRATWPLCTRTIASSLPSDVSGLRATVDYSRTLEQRHQPDAAKPELHILLGNLATQLELYQIDYGAPGGVSIIKPSNVSTPAGCGNEEADVLPLVPFPSLGMCAYSYTTPSEWILHTTSLQSRGRGYIGPPLSAPFRLVPGSLRGKAVTS